MSGSTFVAAAVMRFVRAVSIVLAILLTPFAARAQVVATFDGATVPNGFGVGQIALNPATHRVYVAGDYANVVTMIDGATNSTAQIAVGRRPRYVAVNTATNRIYSSNQDDGTVSVIDGATHAVATLPIGGYGPISINERTNRIFVIRQGTNGEVTAVDGAANTWYTIATGSRNATDLVANPDTNRVYVAHSAGDMRAIDTSSTSDHPPIVAIAVPGPFLVALIRAANKIYATTNDPSVAVVEIDGATHVPTPIPGRGVGAVDIVANSVTNRVYVSLQDRIAVIDGGTRSVSYIPTGNVGKLAVDTARNRIYASGGNNQVLVIDGATQNFSRFSLPESNGATALAVDAATNRIYAVGNGAVVLDGGAIPTPGANYGANLQGMWWNWPAGSESGWGFNITHQGNTIFATWFTYDTDGSPLWFVAPNAARVSDTVYAGTAYRTAGPAYNAATFDPAAVHTTVVGDLRIALTNKPDQVLLQGTINGTSFSKTITQQLYATPVPTCTAGGTPGAQPNYQDMWWSAPPGGESGWGLNLAHQGDTIFAVLFLYDEGGKAMWLVASNVARTGNANYSGTLYRTAGTPYTRSWNQSQMSAMPAGTLSLAFPDANNGTLTYSYGGITRTKAITRQVFASPATVCR